MSTNNHFFRFKRSIVCLLILSMPLVVCLTVFAEKNLLPVYNVKKSKTGDWETLLLPKSKVLNNVWGKDKLTNYSQKIFTFTSKKGNGFGWKWDWPKTYRVVAYPEIIYGGNPWHKSRAKEFPHLLKKGPVTVSFDISMEVKPVCNLALEFWLSSSNKPTKKTITHEIMIWQANRGMTPSGTRLGRFKHNGAWYTVLINKNHDPGVGSDATGWKYVAFVAEKECLKDTLHIDKFINYLVAKKQLTKNRYMTGIEFGSEIVGGRGTVLFHSFKVKVSKKR